MIARALLAALAVACPVCPTSGVTGCTVTSNADSGVGTLRQLVADAACPAITFSSDLGTIVVTAPIVVSRPVYIAGPVDGDVPGSERLTVGTADLPFEAIAQPTVEIVNVGDGDGLSVTSPGVRLDHLAVRGTKNNWRADVAVRGVDGFTAWGLVLGTDPVNGVEAPPAEHRTQSSTFLATGSTNVKVNQLVSGWTAGLSGGTVIFETTTVSHLYRSLVVGSAYGTKGPASLDAVTLSFGAADIIIRETIIADTSSSSAVELHTADRVWIDDSSLLRSGRSGVAVFDARDVRVTGVDVVDAGTCDQPLADMAGVTVYRNSSAVSVTHSSLATRCDVPLVAVL